MKRTVYYQTPGQFQHPNHGDAVWFPEDCQGIEIEDGNLMPGEALEVAAEAVLLAEYERLEKRGYRSYRMHDCDTLAVYVSESRDIPGKPYRAKLHLQPSATAENFLAKRPIRLPDAEELAAAAA